MLLFESIHLVSNSTCCDTMPKYTVCFASVWRVFDHLWSCFSQRFEIILQPLGQRSPNCKYRRQTVMHFLVKHIWVFIFGQKFLIFIGNRDIVIETLEQKNSQQASCGFVSLVFHAIRYLHVSQWFFKFFVKKISK